MIALAVFADGSAVAGFFLMVEGRTESAEQVDLVLDLFEQLHLDSIIGRLELRTGDCMIGHNRFVIQNLNRVGFLSADLACLLVSNSENFG